MRKHENILNLPHELVVDISTARNGKNGNLVIFSFYNFLLRPQFGKLFYLKYTMNYTQHLFCSSGLEAAPVGSYPEELLAVAPGGLPSWDDVRVRYDYYKKRGYLRGKIYRAQIRYHNLGQLYGPLRIIETWQTTELAQNWRIFRSANFDSYRNKIF